MQRDLASVVDILQSAYLIQTFIQGKDQAVFDEDVQCQYAIIRALEIIGEATTRLSDEFKTGNPSIPWQKMKGMRNLLIHAYDDVNLIDVWEVATVSIPALITQLELIVPPKTK